MEKRKNGFTLIELLAVIVILAIIALIAVPVIMNIINKANKSAFKDTAYGVISAGELYYAEQLLEPNGMQEDVTIDLPDATKKLQIKGEVPTGSILITKEGKVAIAVHNNRYCVTKGIEEKDVTVTEDIANCNLPSGGNQGNDETISLPDKKDSLNEYTWDEIQAIAKSDVTLSDYNINIGDTKEYEEKIYYLVSDERSEAYDGLVFIFNSGVKANMNSTTSNDGGYIIGPDGDGSAMKKTVDDMYNSSASDLKSVIKPVKIKANDGIDNYTTIHETPDEAPVYMFLPSVREVSPTFTIELYWNNESYAKYDNYLNNEGDTFDFFADNTTEKINRDNIYSSLSWLRSAYGDDNKSFWLVSNSGSFSNTYADNLCPIVLTFVIG